MDDALVSLAVLAHLVGGTGMLAVARSAHRRRSEPGMLSFAAVAGTYGALGLVLLGFFLAYRAGVAPAVLGVAFAGITSACLLSAVPWIAFVLEYTGRSDLLSRRRLAGLAVPAVGYVLLVVWLSANGSSTGSAAAWIAQSVSALDLLAWNLTFFLLVYLLGLFLVGAVLLVRNAHAYSHVATSTGVLLAAPSVSIGLLIAFLWQLTLEASIPAAGVVFGTTLIVGAGCYAVALFRDDAVGSTSTAAVSVGREAALEELSTPVFTLDDEHRIVDPNDAALETFGLDATDPLGQPIDAVLGQDVAELSADAPMGVEPDGDLWTASTVFLETVGGRRRFRVEAVDLTDDHGRRLGVVVGLEDVTDRALREQRIGILNRVLRHNLRNKLSIVRGHADMLPDDDDVAAVADAIRDAATELLALGERARDVERLLSVEVDVATDVAAVAEEVVATHREHAPETTFQFEVLDEAVVSTPREALAFVLEELCENAVKHNDAADPRVTVRCDREGAWARVQVIDNGPALSEQELVAIDADAESPLQHGSGLGLWSVRWVVTAFGGHLEVAENDDRGSTILVLLPVDGAGTTEVAGEGASAVDDFDATTAGD